MVHGQAKAGDTAMVAPALRDIGIIELLECDPRPTIILDLQQPQYSSDDLHTVFSNAAFKRLPPILDPAQLTSLASADHDELELYANFKRWATSSPIYGHATEGYTTPFSYRNLSWTCSTVRKRWRIISGSATGLEDNSAGSFSSLSGGSQKGGGQDMSTASTGLHAQREKGKSQASIYPAWVNQLPASEHTQFFKSTDWSATALGPLETWSDSLRQMTRLLMSDSRAAALFWYRSRFK